MCARWSARLLRSGSVRDGRNSAGRGQEGLRAPWKEPKDADKRSSTSMPAQSSEDVCGAGHGKRTTERITITVASAAAIGGHAWNRRAADTKASQGQILRGGEQRWRSAELF
jgi:hypothetical protein